VDAADRLERALQRLDERVRRWAPARWETRTASRGGVTKAQVAYELAVTLAALAREAGSAAPDVRPPQLPAYALADQLVVLGREVLDAVGDDESAAPVAQRARAAVENAHDLLG
jgi:hypothetical protein